MLNKEKESFIEIYNDVTNFPTISDVADEWGVSPRTVRRRASELRSEGEQIINRQFVQSSGQQGNLFEDVDEELQKYNVRLAKNNQKHQDITRIERKSFREYARIENAVEEYVSSIKELLEENSFHIDTVRHEKSGNEEPVGIVQLSDLHLNEEIDLPNNKYNFEIASKRIKKHIDRAKRYFSGLGITDVVVTFTGDMNNSNRRMDELLTNSMNRAKATFLTVDILRQALCDLNEFFNLTVVSVTGNESRIEKDVGWERDIAQDNFDFMVHNMLAYQFLEKDGVTFIDCSENPLEQVITVGNSNILLIHGHNGIASNPSVKVPKKRAQYINRGIEIDYVIMGHIHETCIGDYYARSSGLPGANAYSENALNLSSRAAQNLYVFYSDKSHDSIKIDLQNTDNVVGYSFDRALEAYNSKSESKDEEGTVIVKVVV